MTEKLRELCEQVDLDRETSAELMVAFGEKGVAEPANGDDPSTRALLFAVQSQLHSMEVAIHTQSLLLVELLGGNRQ